MKLFRPIKLNRLILFFLLTGLMMSQNIGPNGKEYTNKCTSPKPFNEVGSATAYYNDPNGDCISNDFIVDFDWGGGRHSYWTPDSWRQSAPFSNGYYDFNQPNWQCCDPEVIGQGSNGGGACPCEWSFDPGKIELTITCPTDC